MGQSTAYQSNMMSMVGPLVFGEWILYSERSTFMQSLNACRLYYTAQLDINVLPICIELASTIKRRLYILPCGRWLVKMVCSDSFDFPVHWKSTVIESHHMASSMSRIIYLWISPRKLPKLSLGRQRIWYKSTLMLSIASLISYHTACFFYLSPQVCHSALWCQVTCDADQWGSYKCIVNVKHISIFYA